MAPPCTLSSDKANEPVRPRRSTANPHSMWTEHRDNRRSARSDLQERLCGRSRDPIRVGAKHMRRRLLWQLWQRLPGPAGVRAWEVMSRGRAQRRCVRSLPEATDFRGTPVQVLDSHSIPTSIPSEFPRIAFSGRAPGQDQIDAAIQTTSTSKVRRVDFGGCEPLQPPKLIPGANGG